MQLRSHQRTRITFFPAAFWAEFLDLAGRLKRKKKILSILFVKVYAFIRTLFPMFETTAMARCLKENS